MPIPFGGQGPGWGGGQMRRRLSDMFGGSGGFGGQQGGGMGLSNLMARMGQASQGMGQHGGMAPVASPASYGGIEQAPQPGQYGAGPAQSSLASDYGRFGHMGNPQRPPAVQPPANASQTNLGMTRRKWQGGYA